jgi:GNAT superfamily N-acetyltransferase
LIEFSARSALAMMQVHKGDGHAMAAKLINLSARLESVAVRNLIDQLEYPIDIREERTESILSSYRDDPSLLLFGIKEAGVLVGAIGLLPKPPSAAAIRHIVVRRENRGKGIGRMMIEAVCQEFSLASLEAETDSDAVDFYRQCGFAIKSLGAAIPGIERYRCRRDSSATPCA